MVKVWIGGNYTAGDVQWVTGEAPIYTFWDSPGYPKANLQCMQMMVYNGDPQGMWLQYDCQSVALYVCEKDLA